MDLTKTAEATLEQQMLSKTLAGQLVKVKVNRKSDMAVFKVSKRSFSFH